MYESTIIGLVGPPYPNCSLVAFCAFTWLRLCAFGACKIFVKKKKNNNREFKTALIISFTGHQHNFRLLYLKILQVQKCK